MDNPFKDKWGIIVWQNSTSHTKDKFFGLLTGHDGSVECNDYECSIYNDEHQTPLLFDTEEEAKAYCKATSNPYASYAPIQMP